MDSLVPVGEKNTMFRGEQKNDTSLCECFAKAQQGDFRCAKNGKWHLYIKDQILYRYFAHQLSVVVN